VLSVRPPHLNGPHFHFILKDGVLTGSILSATAPAGSVHVQIAEDGAEGYGPLGPVSMDYTVTPDSTVAEGMWNGSRVHIVFRRDSIKGTIADNSDSLARGDPANSMRVRGVPMTVSPMSPMAGNSSCEYFLTDVAPDGSLTGGSICSGMPQPTRLEVPQAAEKWLTHHELVTLLVAVLSAPPEVTAENFGPRFETQTAPGTPAIPGTRRR
jgi:hypothetical protein